MGTHCSTRPICSAAPVSADRHLHACTRARTQTHTPSPSSRALLMAAKAPFKRAWPPTEPCSVHWAPCHQGQGLGKDILTSSLSLPQGHRDRLPSWGSRKCLGTKMMPSGGAGNSCPGYTDPCPWGRGQSNWLEPPAHLPSVPSGAK